MKVAEATYTGRSRSKVVRGRSGERYTFRRSSAGSTTVSIEDPRDARQMERASNIDVDWTLRGKLKAKFDSVEAVLSEQYQQKRSLATELGIDFDGTPDEETLDEQLREELQSLHERGDI